MKFNTITGLVGLIGLFCAGINFSTTGSTFWILIGCGCAFSPVLEILKASDK